MDDNQSQSKKDAGEAKELLRLLMKELKNRIETNTATASDLSVLRQLLKDNNITIDPLAHRDELDDLMGKLGIPKTPLSDFREDLPN